jgi:undecaprenyl pyrophosphate phosphatase UppP
MDQQAKKLVLYIAIGVIITLVCGAFLDFYPFLGDDLVVREIQFCTFIICTVIAICTAVIISKKNNNNAPGVK